MKRLFVNGRAQATIEKQVTIDSKNLNKELAALTKPVA